MVVHEGARGVLQRLGCRVGLVLFAAARLVIPAFRKQPCYWRVCLIWCTLNEEQRTAVRINISLDVSNMHCVCGHIWLTKDGEAIGEKRDASRRPLKLVGSCGRVDYWIDTPACSIDYRLTDLSEGRFLH
ncbi:hypothetical protein LLG46_13650 [bacterium]|nr:hypothetical protein [bacterium]